MCALSHAWFRTPFAPMLALALISWLQSAVFFSTSFRFHSGMLASFSLLLACCASFARCGARTALRFSSCFGKGGTEKRKKGREQQSECWVRTQQDKAKMRQEKQMWRRSHVETSCSMGCACVTQRAVLSKPGKMINQRTNMAFLPFASFPFLNSSHLDAKAPLDTNLCFEDLLLPFREV